MGQFKEIEIKGVRLNLYPRSAYDVLNWREFIQQNTPINDYKVALLIPIVMLRDSLKSNIRYITEDIYNSLKKLRLITAMKKLSYLRKVRKIVDVTYLSKSIYESDLKDYIEIINELENNNEKKLEPDKKKVEK